MKAILLLAGLMAASPEAKDTARPAGCTFPWTAEGGLVIRLPCNVPWDYAKPDGTIRDGKGDRGDAAKRD